MRARCVGMGSIVLLLSACAALGNKGGGRYHLSPAPSGEYTRECIVILHGLARTSRSVSVLQRAFNTHGFKTLSIDYPSTELPLQQLVNQVLIPYIQEACPPSTQRLHFIGHSLGGILSRLCVQTLRPPKLGSLVMIAPPNKGSHLVDRLAWLPLFNWINGPAGREISTHQNSVPNNLHEPDYPLMVIAGNKSANPFYSILIPGDDDGKVAVDYTKVNGMTEYLEVPYSHTFIMNKPEVIKAAIEFVKREAQGLNIAPPRSTEKT